jgi:hypothetical protein
MLTAQELGRLIPASDAVIRTERRATLRFPFVTTQRLCESLEYGVPDASQFYDIECQDLSQSGISFTLPARPTFHFAFLALGDPPVYWVIKVVRTNPQSDGRYCVGCRFVRRVSPS